MTQALVVFRATTVIPQGYGVLNQVSGARKIIELPGNLYF